MASEGSADRWDPTAPFLPLVKPLNLVWLGSRALGTVLSTTISHLVHARSRAHKSDARKHLSYDQAFELVKSFLLQSSHGTVEDLQQFCNTYVPAPFYVLTVRVLVPPSCLNASADILIKHVGASKCLKELGGTKWWQRRPRADGCLEAEWIAMKKDWNGQDLKENLKKPKHSERLQKPPTRHMTDEYHADLDAQTCIFYVHGGGHYFGSLNTHRYSIWRMAKKINGRAFSAIYRLSPQYPFPCALQDCLAAYLYLIEPPPGAPHKAIDPSKIVFAGDSAGGALLLSLLCMLRDGGLPSPAGACLVSPWVDLTESFPSIMQNIATDVIPPAGFIHRPSLLWPPLDPALQQRVDIEMIDKLKAKVPHLFQRFYPNLKIPEEPSTMQSKLPDSAQLSHELSREEESGSADLGDRAEPSDCMRLNIDGEKVEMRDQIHLYALNSQLGNPLVSPALQPSLAGLPPLLILAGDGEVLLDEIIYAAYKAAHPDCFPLRSTLLSQYGNRERLERIKDLPPTQVHLQVYDSLCHDVTLFSFIPPARFAYSIASFTKAVTTPGYNLMDPKASSLSKQSGSDSSKIRARVLKNLPQTIYSGDAPYHRPAFHNNMIRERVDTEGVVRSMEPMEALAACQLETDNIGLIHAAPAKRYLQGRTLWDQKYRSTAKWVLKARRKEVARAVKDEEQRMRSYDRLNGETKDSGFLGVWRMEGEKPPPSSLAARKDSPQARKLARTVEEQYEHTPGGLRLWQKLQGFWSMDSPDEKAAPKANASTETLNDRQPPILFATPVDSPVEHLSPALSRAASSERIDGS